MTACPDHETLALFIEHRLAEPPHSEVERHVSACASCLDVVAAALPARDPDRGQTEATRAGSMLHAPQFRPRSRMWPRAVVAALAILVTGSLGFFATGVATEYARTTALRVATERLGVPVSVTQLDVGISSNLRTLTVSALDVDLATLGRAAAAEITLSPGRLASGSAALRSVRLLAPEFSWALSGPDGTRPGPTDPLTGVLAAVPVVDIVDGTLRIARPDGSVVVLEHVTMTTRTEGTRVHVQAAGSLETGTFRVAGTLDVDEAAHVDLTIGGRDVPSAVLPYLRDWVGGQTMLALRITGTVDDLRWAGRVRVADAELHGIQPRRDLSTAFRLDPGMLLPAGESPSDVRVSFRIDATGWRVPRAYLSQGDLETHAVVRGGSDGRVVGEGTFWLSAATSDPLLTRYRLLRLLRAPDGRLALPFRMEGVPGRIVIAPRR